MLDFNNLPKPQNNKEINEQFYGSLQSPQEDSKQNKIENELKKIEPKLKLTFKNNVKEAMKNFIKANQKVDLKDKVTKNDVRKKEEALKNELEKANFSKKDIKRIIKCCEDMKVTGLKERQVEKEHQQNQQQAQDKIVHFESPNLTK